MVTESLRPGWSPPPVTLRIVSDRGGLGDNIARIPAIRYMHKTHEHVWITVYWQDYFYDLAKVLLPEGPRLQYKKISEAPFMMPKPYVRFDAERLTSLSLHLTDHASLMLMDTLLPTEEKMYPQPASPISAKNIRFWESLPGYWCDYLEGEMNIPPYVVFTTDYTAPSRQWPAVHVNTLAKKLRDQGLTPVLIGKTEPMDTGTEGDPVRPKANDGLKSEYFVDLRDKTTLVEALGIMQRAKAVVGVDNGLLHLAHCTDTPVVMGFTTLKPEHRVPFREWPGGTAGNWSEHGLTKWLEPLVPCNGCQSRGFAINHDWRICPFDDYLCTMTLTGDRFYEKLQALGVV